MKVSSLYPFRGVLMGADGVVIDERGYFSLHAARRSVVSACVSAANHRGEGVTARIYRGSVLVSSFSSLSADGFDHE